MHRSMLAYNDLHPLQQCRRHCVAHRHPVRHGPAAGHGDAAGADAGDPHHAPVPGLGANQSRWGINLSSNLLQNSAFLIWLDRQLLNDPNTSANLVFELDEEHLERNLTGAKRVFELLRRNGSRSAICNFGKG